VDAAYTVSRECRSWRHQWRPYRAWKIKGGYEEQRQCVQCGSLVVRLLDARGYQISRRIIYADGYLVKGMGRLTEDAQAELRLAGVRELAKREQPSE
jgi:hypothetical protein